jgi:hypothetical protein
MYIRLHVRCPFFFSCFNDLEISPQFSKNIQIPYFFKTRLVEAELFHAGGQTGMTKPTVALRNFANALKTQP